MSACIIIPAYNAGKYLAEAIESALGQSLAAAQIIVVDDGSTDDTAAVAERFGDAVMLLRQKNAGVSAARNHGAKQSKADWLLFLDADDRLLPDALVQLSTRAADVNPGVAYGQTIYFDDETGERRTHGLVTSEGHVPSATRASFWKSAIATPGAAIIRRELFTQLGGFSRDFDTLADRDLWIKAGMLAEFGFTGVPVIEKRSHGDNMSGNLARALRQAVEVQLAFHEWCARRDLDPSFLEATPPRILDNVLRKAMDVHSLDALHAILALAHERGLASPLVPEAERFARLPAPAARLGLQARSTWQRLLHLFSDS